MMNKIEYTNIKEGPTTRIEKINNNSWYWSVTNLNQNVEENNQQTFPSIVWGISPSREEGIRHSQDAMKILFSYDRQEYSNVKLMGEALQVRSPSQTKG